MPNAKCRIQQHTSNPFRRRPSHRLLRAARLGGGNRIILERYAAASQKISAAIRFLPAEPQLPTPNSDLPSPDALVLLTNGIGGMARLCVDLGRVNSKYDCVLGANLNPNFPVDRHVFVKRIRVWVNADGFLSPLDFKNLASFKAGSARRLEFCRQRGRWPHGGNRIARGNARRQKHDRFSIQPPDGKICARQTIARRTPTCA